MNRNETFLNKFIEEPIKPLTYFSDIPLYKFSLMHTSVIADDKGSRLL